MIYKPILRLEDVAERMGVHLTEGQAAQGYNKVIELVRDSDYCRKIGISDSGPLTDEAIEKVYRHVLKELPRT